MTGSIKKFIGISVFLATLGVTLLFAKLEAGKPGMVSLAGVLFFTGICSLCLLLFDGALQHSRFSQMFLSSRWLAFTVIGTLSSVLFFSLPHIIFDDTGFVLRYLENFYQGYWFRYNIQDAPVYGISGFLHGLFAGLLCFLHIAKPLQAVFISNYTGFVITSWYIYLLFTALIPRRSAGLLLWMVTITCVPTYLVVAGAGLETSLHLALVSGAVYYLVIKNHRLFYLFAALMIISKLDAVPVAGVCFVYHLLLNKEMLSGKQYLRKELKLLFLFFLLPLAAGVALIVFIFGSPLPQSAYSKLYYHLHPRNHWFPFLQYFLEDRFRIILLLLGWVLGMVNWVEAWWKKDPAVLLHSIYWSLFLGVMALYYFYNPYEKMFWYYSMPELFLCLHILYGTYYYTWNYPVFPRYTMPRLLVFLVLFCLLSWQEVYRVLKDLEKSTISVEGERLKIGQDVAAMGAPGKVLLAGHGLISYSFGGYVIDMSGLNSRLATQYRLNIDSIIATFHPDLMVSHAGNAALDICNRSNYKLLGLYRNINLYNNYSWVVLGKSYGGPRRRLSYLDKQLNAGGFISDEAGIRLTATRGMIRLSDTLHSRRKILHLGVNEALGERHLTYSTFKHGAATTPVAIITDSAGSSRENRLVSDLAIDVSGADSVILTSRDGRPFEIFHPLWETVD